MSVGIEITKVEARRLLAEVYDAAGVDVWMAARQDRFGGANAHWMIANGRGDEVLAAIFQLIEGAFG